MALSYRQICDSILFELALLGPGPHGDMRVLERARDMAKANGKCPWRAQKRVVRWLFMHGWDYDDDERFYLKSAVTECGPPGR